MDCRTFKDQHLAFVDGMLEDADLVAMQCHLLECPACDRHDAAVRRGLSLVHDMPEVEPSADFQARLFARLRQVKQADARSARIRGPGPGGFVAAALGVIAAGFVAAMTLDWTEPARDLRMAPIVAMEPEIPPSLMDQSAVMSAATGGFFFPAAAFAEQAPVRFAGESFGW